MADHLPPDLEHASDDELEALVEAIEQGRIGTRTTRSSADGTRLAGHPISQQYRADLKVTIKKFYKWLKGDNRAYPRVCGVDRHVRASARTPGLET